MVSKHYTIKDEVEVTIKVKVSDISISTHQELNELQLADNLKDFKQEIAEHLKNKLQTSYWQQEVTWGVDWWSFDVE